MPRRALTHRQQPEVLAGFGGRIVLVGHEAASVVDDR